MKRFVIIAASLLYLAVPSLAFAFNPLGKPCTASPTSSQSAACSNDGSTDPISGKGGVLKKATLVIATIAGIAAVIIIIVGGLQFVLSNGDPQKAASARSAIVGAVIGLVIIVAAQAIVLIVISKL